ncbi:LacI family DNA-binding transcriptional regulator [Ferrimonas pelagia]|uniref:LacI family DNA-binding transcriptional regulator n=1 Tax=Ferrimonas pelagia TaxID=1177826 RepID=A0ABP9F034_9GAMM
MHKSITIQQVAERANVSIMTVSRVLNGSSKVAESTRQRVQEAMQALGYRPNVAARRLASARSYMIGLLYDNPSEGYVSQFLLGALEHSRRKGYHLVVEHCRGDELTAVEQLMALLNESQIDSVILLPPLCDDLALLAALRQRQLPFVRVAPDREPGLSPYVCMDDQRAAYRLTQHLIEKGHQKIGFIKGNPNQGVSRQRYAGYLEAMAHHGLTTPEDWVQQGYFCYRSGMEAAHALLSQQDRPSAVFASNDDMAAAVVAEAHRCGLKVPEQLAVVGFDDTQLATAIWPQLTTIRQPIRQMAQRAVDILADQPELLAEDDHPGHVLAFEVILRGSSTTGA